MSRIIKPAYKTIPPLNLLPADTENRFIHTYLSFYGLQFSSCTHHIGVLQAENNTIVVQIFRPAQSIGTILLSHGLFDHSAAFKHVINCCLEMQYTVVTMDYPGHGLSSGSLYEYKDFRQYADSLNTTLDFCIKFLNSPFHLAGHSTGCAAILELLYTSSVKDNISSILFLSPLVRPAHWNLIQIAYSLLRNRIVTVPRIYRSISSDSDFVNFCKRDPLQAKKLPVNWVDAMLNWNIRMQKRGSINKSILVIQGLSDQVVDWEYNIPFLEERFHTKIIRISNAMHHVHNECSNLRAKALSAIKEYLSEST